MKIAIITDTHFGGRGGSTSLIKHQDKFFSKIFFPKLEEENIDTILHMGDLFDVRKYINYQVLHDTKRIFLDVLKKENITMHIIAGNHDTAYRNTNRINSLDLLLRDYKNINVYDDDVVMLTYDKMRIAMVPWINPSNEEKIYKSIKSSKADFLLGHFEIIGHAMSGGVVCEHGLESKIFANFEQVLSGHFHVPSEKGNIKYIGAPYQMDWSDYGGDRGFYILDTDTRLMEFVKNEYTLFNIIQYDDEGASIGDIEELDEELFKDSFIKIDAKNVTSPALLTKFIEKIESFDVADLKVIDVPVFKAIEEDEEDSEENVGDTRKMVASYVDRKGYDERMSAAIKKKFNEYYEKCEKV